MYKHYTTLVICSLVALKLSYHLDTTSKGMGIPPHQDQAKLIVHLSDVFLPQIGHNVLKYSHFKFNILVPS